MSWQPYVDDSLIGEGFRHACITSHEGAVWAATPEFRVRIQPRRAAMRRAAKQSVVQLGGAVQCSVADH